MKFRQKRSSILDLALALHRELIGRTGSWEPNFLPRPVTPETDLFRDGLRSWAKAVGSGLPAFLAAARRPEDLVDLVDDERLRHGTTLVTTALTAAAPTLAEALPGFEDIRKQAAAEINDFLTPARYLTPLCAALGTAETERTLDLHLVPLAPAPPATGFLIDAGKITGLYVDCRRFRGSTLADAVLTMLGWAQLKSGAIPENHLSTELVRRLPGSAPYQRRLRVVLTKILVEMTAGHLVRSRDATHRPCVDVLGTKWRYARLHAVAERHWPRHLDGDIDRDEALNMMAADLSAHSPRWFVDSVDPSSTAADFYLLEWLTAAGDRTAGARLFRWLPDLCAELAGHLDNVIGNELGHYERARTQHYPQELADFITEINQGDSRVTWQRLRRERGHGPALRLATDAFAGPGVEFGGEAWAPVAAMMRRYVRHELPDRVFVDQCFTLEHNNGSLFDKYHDTTTMRAVLDAQAATDLDTLLTHASAEVRELCHAHRLASAEGHPAWLGSSPPAPARIPAGPPGWSAAGLHTSAPGTVGCGDPSDRNAFDPLHDPMGDSPVRVRQTPARRPFSSSLRTYRSLAAVLHTELGDIHLALHPDETPYTADNFVGLATGSRTWTDPLTGTTGEGGFYDGTVFHRRVPGFVAQGGDRLGTGHGSAGYRIPDEIHPDRGFEQPFRLAMANLGRDSTGSQFFITLAPAPHLNGQYTIFGEVADDRSKGVVEAIASSATAVRLERVTISAT
ncbi:peptidylprolyl isomerase [Streptomyces sp. 142MFCol3.1]|uniref:peptidylprolyl isomerase n=1 Tax=Streptomyces sp. 142MFCol3.1 TaxID=1172179 RepID=UPI00040D4EEA|nr:peptidylprolyl isomerase [Streptomyces sp. 142MFCol3.1]